MLTGGCVSLFHSSVNGVWVSSIHSSVNRSCASLFKSRVNGGRVSLFLSGVNGDWVSFTSVNEGCVSLFPSSVNRAFVSLLHSIVKWGCVSLFESRVKCGCVSLFDQTRCESNLFYIFWLYCKLNLSYILQIHFDYCPINLIFNIADPNNSWRVFKLTKLKAVLGFHWKIHWQLNIHITPSFFSGFSQLPTFGCLLCFSHKKNKHGQFPCLFLILKTEIHASSEPRQSRLSPFLYFIIYELLW